MKNIIKIQIIIFLIMLCKLNGQGNIIWKNTVSVAASHYGNNHPRITCNEKGEAYMIWGRTSDQSVQFAYWDGNKFSTPIKLNVENAATASWMGPDIASRNDTIYTVLKSVPEDDPNSHMFLVSSFDGGRSFSVPIRIDDIGTDISRFPTITIDQYGHPIVAYMRFDAGFKDSRWVVTRSTDYGKSFLPAILASGWGKSKEICDCCPGTIVCEGSICVMLYRDNNNNLRDSWASISKDNGATFTSGFNIDNNNWNLSSCPATGPDGIILDDNIFGIFMNGARNLSRNYFSRSSISSEKFIESTNLANNVQNLRAQNYPRIAGYGKALAFIGTQSVNTGTVQIPIWFTENYEKGISPIYQLVDELNISNCDIAMNQNTVFVVWQDDNARVINFRLGEYLQTSISKDQNKNQIIFEDQLDTWVFKGELIESIKVISSNGQLIFSENKINQNIYSLLKNKFTNGMYLFQVNSTTSKNIFKSIKN